MRLLRFPILFVIAVVAVAFAVANRQMVRFIMDPLGRPDSDLFVEMPLFVLLIGAILLGFLIGGLAAWMGQSRWRNAARKRAKEVVALQKANDRLTRHLRILERTPQIQSFGTQPEIEERPRIH